MNIKEIGARIFFYTRLGWGNYIAWWLGAIAYITIIYSLILVNIFPAGLFVYALIFVAIMVASLVLGYTLKRAQIYGVEHKINTETNPYINIPIGAKEILNYRTQIFQLELQIESLKKQIEVCRALGVDATVLESYLPKIEGYKAKFQDLLSKAVE